MLLELLSGRWRLGEMSGRCQSVQSVHVNLAAVARGPAAPPGTVLTTRDLTILPSVLLPTCSVHIEMSYKYESTISVIDGPVNGGQAIEVRANDRLAWNGLFSWQGTAVVPLRTRECSCGAGFRNESRPGGGLGACDVFSLCKVGRDYYPEQRTRVTGEARAL